MKYVVKFGGSLLTYKDIKDYPKTASDVRDNPGKYLKLNNINKIADIIKRAKKQNENLELILVTGAGCCGHPQVKAKFPVSVIQEIAIMPAASLADALYEKDIGPVIASPHMYDTVTCLESDGKHGLSYELGPIWKALQDNKEYLAISHGDVVPMAEGKTGRLGNYEVISGDDIMPYFGEIWPADKVINVSNVDGVYTEFPPKEGQKPILRILANEKLRDNAHFKEKMEQVYGVKFKDVKDATGGLFAKVKKLYDFTNKTGISSQIAGLDDFENVLRGHHAGTLIEKTI